MDIRVDKRALPGRLNRLLNRPYYVYRPSQLLRRARLVLATDPGPARVMLPWGLDIVVEPTEGLGGAVVRNAVYEIGVSEILYRLVDPHELVLDIGANIGYMTSILAVRVGAHGQVIACEPHPALYGHLCQNVERWRALNDNLALITTMQIALSDRSGRGRLTIPPEFEVNMGLAALVDGEAEDGVEVRVCRLDEVVPREASVGVAKLDVEGHEARVLAGAGSMLNQHRIRDVVFEERSGYPSEAATLLERAGYRVFGIEQHLRGVVLTEPGRARPPGENAPQNFVASCQPDRVNARLAPLGWRVLRSRSRSR